MFKVDEDGANPAGIILLFQKIEACPHISDIESQGLRSPRAIRYPHVSWRNKYLRVSPRLGSNHQGFGNRHECLFVKAIAMNFGR